MIELRNILTFLYKNIGIIGLIFGGFSLFLGAFNIPKLPRFFEAQSGNNPFDSTYTIYINAILWLIICLYLMYFGIRFYYLSKDVEKISQSEKNKEIFKFHLVGALFITGLMIYFILLILNIVKPAQFFPHFLFAGTEDLMDLSIIFNAILFYFLIEILHRVGGNFIKFGMQMGET